MPALRTRYLIAILCLGFFIKGALFAWAYLSTGASPLQLMHAHDGGEYLKYARLIANGRSGPLPTDILRHDPGLSGLLAAAWLCTGRLIDLPAVALFTQALAYIISVLLFARLHEKAYPDSQCKPSVIAAFALGYPAALYYGQFNLTELPFTCMILGSILLATSRRYFAAFLLAGICALVRSTGLLLVASLILTHPAFCRILQNPRDAFQKSGGATSRLIAAATLGILPWLCVQYMTNIFLDTNFSTHKPRFGLPFSGFHGLAEAGIVRSIYIIGVVIFFAISTLGLIRLARQSQWRSQLFNLTAAFTAIFLIFHLCLKTLYYIDHTVWTFDYQDRYLIPLWPLALLAWRHRINWPVATMLTAISIAMSMWWLKNYVIAAGT